MEKKLRGNKLGKEEAWNRFISGEHAYFENIFKNYYKSMYGYGLKLCSQHEVVKDCIQELFRNIWERRDELDHIESPRVYLFVSLRRKILLTVKKQRRQSEGLGKAIDENANIYFGQEEIIIRNEVKFQQKKKLQEALNQLSNRQKEVIYLHFYNGMSYGEIENILSINRQSVRNHMYRAMESLRCILDKEIMKLVISLLVVFLL